MVLDDEPLAEAVAPVPAGPLRDGVLWLGELAPGCEDCSGSCDGSAARGRGQRCMTRLLESRTSISTSSRAGWVAFSSELAKEPERESGSMAVDAPVTSAPRAR